MDLRKLLYVGVLAASVGCDSQERIEKYKGYCEEELTDATKVAQETGSVELTKVLNSKQWCKGTSSDEYRSDWVALMPAVHGAVRDYCDQKWSEASHLIARNEDMLAQLFFHTHFSCNGQYRQGLDIQTRNLQAIIDSYQEK